jgi:dsDNA-specific endonuclease/ATPase MutS2
MIWLLLTLLLLLALTWLGRRWLGGEPRHEDPLPPPGDEEVEAIVEHGNELDLHGVPPREVADLVDAFIDACASRQERFVRIIHGRGIGVLRRIVRSRLSRHPRVLAYGDAPPPSGWGATVVELSTLPDVEPAPRSD